MADSWAPEGLHLHQRSDVQHGGDELSGVVFDSCELNYSWSRLLTVLYTVLLHCLGCNDLHSSISPAGAEAGGRVAPPSKRPHLCTGTGDPHLDECGEQALSNIDLFLWVSSCGVTQGLEF
jgi:hypothetical protein